MRVVTGVGISESWRLPGSGAGPSPDRLFLGSEGTLGVITEAWMRLQDRPVHRASASVHFDDRSRPDSQAVRAIAQSGLHPEQLPAARPGRGGAWPALGDRTRAGARGGVGPRAGGRRGSRSWARSPATTAVCRSRPGTRAADTWRSAFLRMPYVRDGLARDGRDRGDLRDRVHLGPRGRPLSRGTGGHVGRCRVGHRVAGHRELPPHPRVPGRTGARTSPSSRSAAPGARWPCGTRSSWPRWRRCTGTGRRSPTTTRSAATTAPGYDRQRPEPFALALRAAKSALDPHGILNPGVLV